MAEIDITLLPEDLQTAPSVTKFAKDGKVNVANVIKSYSELEKMMGERVKIPGENASVEEIQEFRRKLGVPESIDEYGIFDEIDPEDYAAIVKAAHEEGVTPRQFQRLMKESSEKARARLEKLFTESQTKAEEVLRAEWGDKYEYNLANAKRAMQELAPEGFQELVEKNPAIGNNPDVIKMFSTLWLNMKEAAFHTNRASLTPEDIDRKIVEIESDPAYHDRSSPKWEYLRKERTRLYKIKYPD
jgi:hypothetical protein